MLVNQPGADAGYVQQWVVAGRISRNCISARHAQNGVRDVEGGPEIVRTEADIRKLLAEAGLRPTRQRILLAALLFGQGDRHVTAETLHGEVARLGEHVSLATVYNTLHQFREAGLLRQLAVDGTKSYFDTNMTEHHHFFNEDDQTLVDMPEGLISIASTPEAPEGCEVVCVEVIVRLRRKSARTKSGLIEAAPAQLADA